jgi:ABC-2 type transport system ATP-binding protein
MTCLVSSHVLGEIEKTVDEVVIIRNGRLVAEGPIDEIVGGGSGALLLRLPSGNGPAGAEALAAAGLKGSLDGDSIRVEAHGKSGSAIAEILANAGIYPDELRSEGANLEDVFINLTSGEAADER